MKPRGSALVGMVEWKRSSESGDAREGEGVKEGIWMKGVTGRGKGRRGGGDGKKADQQWWNEPKNQERRQKIPTSSLGKALLLKKVFCSLCRQSRTLIDSLSSDPLARKSRTDVSSCMAPFKKREKW